MASRTSVSLSAGGQHQRSSMLATRNQTPDERDGEITSSPRPVLPRYKSSQTKQLFLLLMFAFAACGLYYNTMMMRDGDDSLGVGGDSDGLLTPAAIARLQKRKSKAGKVAGASGPTYDDVVAFESDGGEGEEAEEGESVLKFRPAKVEDADGEGEEGEGEGEGEGVGVAAAIESGEEGAEGAEGAEGEEVVEDEVEEDLSDKEIPEPEIKDGTYTDDGQWRFSGGIWRRVTPLPADLGTDEEDKAASKGGRTPRSWFDRRTVQARLDFERFIHCKEGRRSKMPNMEGLQVKNTKLPVDEYIIHQGNFEHLGKGAGANRTQRIRNVELLPPDGENTLTSHHWGTCAVVGNSGILRYTDFANAIDSHDTVLRLNQAPTYGYSRRVGKKVTHRLLNKLWTRTYRNGGGMKKGVVLPMEKDLTFIVSRATSQEYELLTDFLADLRPDVTVMYLSSRTTSMSQPLMMKYRERLCKAGYGPYKGLNVPSSGYVAIYMLMHLCDRVTVYGFGVEGMGQRAVRGGPGNFNYHYYKGVGSRHTGDDVHSFDTEEKLLQQLGREGAVDFCTYFPPNNNTENWSCGCRHENIAQCQPNPRPRPGKDDDDDCDGEECEVLARQRKEDRMKKEGGGAAKKDKGKGGGAAAKKRPARDF